jgi:hypothetical protein
MIMESMIEAHKNSRVGQRVRETALYQKMIRNTRRGAKSCALEPPSSAAVLLQLTV